MWTPLIPTPVTGPAGLRNSSTGGRGASSDAELTVVRAARHAHDVVTPAADRPIARLLQLATSMSIPVGPSTDRCSRAVRLDASESRRALAASHQLGGSAWALTRKIG